MRTVETQAGERYLLLTEAGDTCLVRDPATGETQYVDADRLSAVDGEPPLAAAASWITDPVRQLLTAVHDDQSLGLVVELVDRGPVAAVELYDAYDLCESDFHGLLAELRAADLVSEVEVAGGPGYDATETALAAIESLRGDSGVAQNPDTGGTDTADSSDQAGTDTADSPDDAGTDTD